MQNLEPYLNQYHGKEWIHAFLPEKAEPWIMGPDGKSDKQNIFPYTHLSGNLRVHLENDAWEWPQQICYFISDAHADTDAFIASLVASGGIKKYGKRDQDFKLSQAGKKAKFIIGGDCFDKGPSTLRLLRMLHLLIVKGAKVELLTGNHDLRSLIGVLSLCQKRTTTNEHLFIRMGLKPLPLFKEILSETIKNKKHYKKLLKKVPDIKKCRKMFYPAKDWEIRFRKETRDILSKATIEKEILKTNEKIAQFESWCSQQDMSLRDIYLAVKLWRQSFIHSKGEFHWYFKRLQLAKKYGSFLFVHAGVDDSAAAIIRSHKIEYINKEYKRLLKKDVFSLYFGYLGNMIRTKYRDVDRKFSKKGVLMLQNSGINTIVHGHDNQHSGQRIMIRHGMVNFECDASMDINTRRKEDVKGLGASVTIIHPDKLVLGISSDYPYIKVFQPKQSLSAKSLSKKHIKKRKYF